MKTLLVILSVIVTVGGCTRFANYGAHHHVVIVDGNLYANHFEGEELNASGRATIDAIPVNAPAIIVIHMTRATDRQVFVRRARHVKAYVKDRGMTDAQVRFDAEYSDAELDPFDPLDTTTACVADDNR